MTLDQFKVILRRAHKRGTALDADLDGAIRRAAQFVEQNYSLQYMRRRFDVTLGVGESTLEIPDMRIKAVLGIRWDVLDTFGRYQKAKKIDFDDIDYPSTRHDSSTVPTEFYLDGEHTLVFTTTTSEELTGEGMLERYSDFPIEGDEDHWLLNNAESLMLCESMMQLGIITRDDRSYAMYERNMQRAIQVMLNADYAARYAGQDISVRA